MTDIPEPPIPDSGPDSPPVVVFPPAARRRRPLWRRLFRWHITWRNPFRLHDPKSHMRFMMIVFAAVGATLLLQPGRYSNTPSYANLLAIMPAGTWGALYLGAAVLKLASVLRYSTRALVVVTHTVSVTLLAVWFVAFVVRYVTDDGTTIVNVTSWGAYLYLSVRSAFMTDDDQWTRAGQ